MSASLREMSLKYHFPTISLMPSVATRYVFTLQIIRVGVALILPPLLITKRESLYYLILGVDLLLLGQFSGLSLVVASLYLG